MSSSRRTFLMSLAASGAVAAISPLSHSYTTALASLADPAPSGGAAPGAGLDLKIGYSAIAWNDQDAQAISDLQTLGFSGIQLRANVPHDFPDPHALRDLLAQHHLKFVALSSGTAPIESSDRQSTIGTHIKNAKYLRDAGGSYLQIVAASTKGRVFSAADYKYEGDLLTEIGKHVTDLGLQTSLHNHMGTMARRRRAWTQFST